MEGNCFCHCGGYGLPLQKALVLCVPGLLLGDGFPPAVLLLHRTRIAEAGRQTDSYPANATRQTGFACNLACVGSCWTVTQAYSLIMSFEIVVVVNEGTSRHCALRRWVHSTAICIARFGEHRTTGPEDLQSKDPQVTSRSSSSPFVPSHTPFDCV